MRRILPVLNALIALGSSLHPHGLVPKDGPHRWAQASAPAAQDLLHRSIVALGGEQALSALRGVSYSA